MLRFLFADSGRVGVVRRSRSDLRAFSAGYAGPWAGSASGYLGHTFLGQRKRPMKVPRSSRPDIPLRNIGTEWGKQESAGAGPDTLEPNCPECGQPFAQSTSGGYYCPLCGTTVRPANVKAPRDRSWPGVLLALFCSLSVVSAGFMTTTNTVGAGQISILVLAAILIGSGALIGFAVSYERWFLIPVAIEFFVVLVAVILMLLSLDFCSALGTILAGQTLLIVYAVGVFLGFLLRRLLGRFS